MDPDLIASLFNYGLIALLIISFIYILCDQYISDETLFDYTILPPSDPRKINYYIEPNPNQSGEPTPAPTVFEPASVYMSFVIPAYNEENRLPPMLNSTLNYIVKRSASDTKFTYEIIIVDDGSRDNTANLVLQYSSRNPNIRLLRQPKNMGKGAAVQAGALHSRGKYILMVDADGATEISEIEALERAMFELQTFGKEAVVVGSRAHLEGESKADRTPIRKFLGLSFHALILLAGVRGVKDTQCGFKLFSRQAARWMFPNQHVQRWCFDPELLVIAKKRKMGISEVPVKWAEIDGSKMKVSAMVKMGIDLVRICVFYNLGLWTIRKKAEFPQNDDEV